MNKVEFAFFQILTLSKWKKDILPLKRKLYLILHYSISLAFLLYYKRGKLSRLFDQNKKTPARVLFVKQGEDIVLLYAFYKKSGKDTEKALEAAFRMLNKMRQIGGMTKHDGV